MGVEKLKTIKFNQITLTYISENINSGNTELSSIWLKMSVSIQFIEQAKLPFGGIYKGKYKTIC